MVEQQHSSEVWLTLMPPPSYSGKSDLDFGTWGPLGCHGDVLTEQLNHVLSPVFTFSLGNKQTKKKHAQLWLFQRCNVEECHLSCFPPPVLPVFTLSYCRLVTSYLRNLYVIDLYKWNIDLSQGNKDNKRFSKLANHSFKKVCASFIHVTNLTCTVAVGVEASGQYDGIHMVRLSFALH